jgi:formate dehydrogenase
MPVRGATGSDAETAHRRGGASPAALAHNCSTSGAGALRRAGQPRGRDLAMANVLCVLYDDPVDGYPPAYARDDVPKIAGYRDGQSAPTPQGLGFTPGELVGCVSGELGLREFLESNGHRLIVTSDKDGADSEFERELPEAEVVISQPFWPAYLTAERIAKAGKLKLALTAGIGSDHVDLQAAIEHGLTVAEVTYSNSISVAEHVVMMILALVRNYIPSHQWVLDGGWNIADCVSRSYDLEGMQVGSVAAGRIGTGVLRRLKPFEVGLHYTDRHRLPPDVEQELNVTFHENVESLVEACDVVTINAPLHPETENMFDAALLAKMKRGAYLINTARGKICDREAVAEACRSGQLAGYAGDVWFPQPAPRDHPWRTMPHHGMTPHTSGTSLSAQARYAAGTREILECWFDQRPIREEYLIVDGGQLAGAGAHAYSAGNATGGSDEAARFGRG